MMKRITTDRMVSGGLMIPESQIDRDNQAQPAFIRVSKLHSIKTRMLVFALIATIIPSVTLGSLAYIQITRFLNQRISQNLRNVTAQVSKELDLSIKERIYDIRIFRAPISSPKTYRSSPRGTPERPSAWRLFK
jgi:hypothetical protein